MLRLFQIDHQRAGRAYSQRECVHSESLEGLDIELLLEPFDGGVVNERPFLDSGDVEILPVLCPDTLLVAFLDNDFLGRQRGQHGPDVVQRTLGDLERACGHVQESCAALVLVEGQAGEEVVLLLVQKLVVEGDARRDQFRDTPFYKLLGEFGILQLVADSHLVARPDKLRKIDVQGVVRESGHLDVAFVPVGFPGLDDAQDLADQHRVIRVGLVEVPDPVKQHRFGVLRLHREKLFDKRSVLRHLTFRHVNA